MPRQADPYGVRLRSKWWWASKDSNHNLSGLRAPWTLGVSAKLSNEAVKCRKYDALQQIANNI